MQAAMAGLFDLIEEFWREAELLILVLTLRYPSAGRELERGSGALGGKDVER